MTQVSAATGHMHGSHTTAALPPGQADVGRPERFLRRAEVLSRTGVSRSHLYWLMERGRFPKSIPLSPRVTVWLESDVDAWITAQIPCNHQRAQP